MQWGTHIKGMCPTVDTLQAHLETDMVDNAFIRRLDVIRSSIRREALVSDHLAVDWLKQSQGAVTFLQACRRSCCPVSGRTCIMKSADLHAPCACITRGHRAASRLVQDSTRGVHLMPTIATKIETPEPIPYSLAKTSSQLQVVAHLCLPVV